MPGHNNSVSIIASTFREILFVDNNSTDATRHMIRALAAAHPIRLIDQDHAALGLAAAVMSGALATQGDVLIVMDADLSHPPERIKDLLAPLFAGPADMVIGSRYVPGGSTPGWPRWRLLLSRTGAILAYPLTGVHDSISGFFAIGRSRLLEYASAPPAGFKIVFETIVRSGRTLRVVEIPIAFRNRVRGKSKMSFVIALRFFVRWLFAVLRHVVHGFDRPVEIARSTMSNASTD